MKFFNKNYLFLIFFNLFNFNLLSNDKLLQDKPVYAVFFKLKIINKRKKLSIIDKKNTDFFYIFYKSLLLFRNLTKFIFFNSHYNNNYYKNFFYRNFLLFNVLENLYCNSVDNFMLKNFFFLRKKKMQLYLYFKRLNKTLIFYTNGIINKKIENKKKCMKKLDKVSIINLKMFLSEILKKKKELKPNTDLFIIFFYLRKLYSKLLKILNKEKFHKHFNLTFFFDLKKSYSLNKVKKKRFIKKKLKKRIAKIDNI